MANSKLLCLSDLPETPVEQFALEGVFANDELMRRPSRPPDHAAEAKGLVALSEILAKSPDEILQSLATIAMGLCRADSAGVSIAEVDQEREIFRWHGVAGKLAPFVLSTMPRDFGHYHYVSQLGVPLHEVLLVPFAVDGSVVGTLWAVAHSDAKKFDAEDVRILTSLSHFASAAYRKRAEAEEREAAELRLSAALEVNKQHVHQVSSERDNLLRILEANPSPNVLWRTDDLIYERVSPTYQSLFPGRQLIGKPFREALPEKEYEHFFEVLRGVFRTGQSVTMPEQLVWFDLDGKGMKARYYTLSFFQIKSADGEPYGVYQQAVDWTDRKKAEAELAFERHKLETIFEETPAAMALWRGAEFVFEKVNPQYQEIFPDRELVGQPFLDACPEFIGSPFIDYLRDVFATGVPFVGKEVHAPLRRTKNGPLEDRYYDFSYLRIKDANGLPYGVYDHAVDVTYRVNARKDLEFEQLKLKTVVEYSTTSIAVLRGPNFIYELTNKSYADLFSKRDLIGKPLLEALPELADQAFPKHAKSVLETGVPYVEREALALLKRTEDGLLEKRYFDQTYSRILDQNSEPYGIFMHAQEVTDRVEARRELEVAKVAAEYANQAKSAFLANMSHEIRTPLGAILGFTDLLRERNLDLKDREQFIDTIARNGRSLTKIIDDILDLAKVESGKLEVEMAEFSLGDLIDDVMDLFRERTRAKRLYLRVNFAKETPTRVVADPTRLRQILINIIGNAVKFTAEGGVTVDIRHEARAQGKMMLVVTVRDTGVGLSSEQKQKLFQPFMQADNSTTRRFGGTGLGLSLSQRLAQALGGSIKIEDGEADAGCVFTVAVAAELPRAKEPVGAELSKVAGAGREPGLPLDGLRILVADDAKDNRFLIERMLSRQGAVVTLVENGLVAFRTAIEGEFDLVLMDLQMPEMDGYEATRSLREPGFKKPIIALTAHAMAEERARTRAAGCDAHLTKPLDQGALVDAVLFHAKRPES